jgi:outer membrane protein OmpA-like peptidoglycan-associated protein
VTLGGGLDYVTPLLNHHLAIRLFQADYQFIHPNYVDDSTNVNAARLSAGLVLGIGSFAPPPPVTISCVASPASIFPGDPVTVTATAGSLDPKLNVIYSWSGVGVTGNGTTVSVSTGSLAAGTYTVNCGVKEGKSGKEGLKPWQVANSSASFTVKAYEPPTIGCVASPSTIKPGDSSTVTATSLSPQNRPLTYSYSAVSGSVSGSGATATFNSTGAPTGPVGITCNVSDDKGQTAMASTSVTITAPYVAPIPHTQALCSITFDKDTKRPARVDNEAKACLDQVALSLQQQSDAKAVVVGESTAAEKAPKKGHKHAKIEDLAGERAVNTKDYLVTEKGIDASRVSVTTGTTDGQTVEDYLVPAGATFTADVAGTTAVDETVVKPQVRKPLAAAPVHGKRIKPVTSVKPPQ